MNENDVAVTIPHISDIEQRIDQTRISPHSVAALIATLNMYESPIHSVRERAVLVADVLSDYFLENSSIDQLTETGIIAR